METTVVNYGKRSSAAPRNIGPEGGAIHFLGAIFLLLIISMGALAIYQFREVMRLRADVQMLKAHVAVLEARFPG